MAPDEYIYILYIKVRSKSATIVSKAVYKNFAILTGKWLCRSLFLIKNFKATLLKRDSNRSVFL